MMKKLTNISNSSLKYFAIAAFFLSQGLVWAQETTTTSTTTKDVNVDLNVDGGSTWYAQPWVWIVGVAIFIIIIVGLLKSNSDK